MEIAKIREMQKQAQEDQKRAHALHSSETAEIRAAQKETDRLLTQTIKLVAGIAELSGQHHRRIQDLEGGRT